MRLDDNLSLDHVGFATTQTSQITNIHGSAQSSLIFVDSILEAIPPPRLSGLQRSGEPLGLDHLLRSQVDRLTRARGCYLDDITSRYFQGMHKWLPVISRSKFHAELIGQVPWPADFSILLLAMFLVVWRPSAESGFDDDRGNLYVVVKMLFAQVQAVHPPSLRLIQSGLLISVFEYGHELKNAALISITSCSKMAYLIRPNPHNSDEVRSETREERNLWWGLAIYER